MKTSRILSTFTFCAASILAACGSPQNGAISSNIDTQIPNEISFPSYGYPVMICGGILYIEEKFVIKSEKFSITINTENSESDETLALVKAITENFEGRAIDGCIHGNELPFQEDTNLVFDAARIDAAAASGGFSVSN